MPVSTGRRSLLALAVGVTMTGAAMAQQTPSAQPSSTTATFGDWTVVCAFDPATGGERTCEMQQPIRVMVPSGDGQQGSPQRIADLALGAIDDAGTFRLVIQVPGTVWLRAPVVLRFGTEGDLAAEPFDGLEHMASYFRCIPTGCLADTDIGAAGIAAIAETDAGRIRLQINPGQEIEFPVSMVGFPDALNALRDG